MSEQHRGKTIGLGKKSERFRQGFNGRKAEAREKVWELRLAGVPFRKIAEEIGCSHTYVIKLYNEALDDYAERIRDQVDRYAAKQVEQYDRIILAHWARRGDPTHAGVIMRAMADKARLLGLNQPVRQEIHVEHTTETPEERNQRVIKEAIQEIGSMTDAQLAAEVASITRADAI